MMVKVFLPIWVLSWIILLPATSVGTNVATNSGLDRFIFGNVAADKQERYAAHIILVYIFTGEPPVSLGFCGAWRGLAVLLEELSCAFLASGAATSNTRCYVISPV